MDAIQRASLVTFSVYTMSKPYVVALFLVKRIHLVSLAATLWMVNDSECKVVVVHGCPCNVKTFLAVILLLLNGITLTV